MRKCYLFDLDLEDIAASSELARDTFKQSVPAVEQALKNRGYGYAPSSILLNGLPRSFLVEVRKTELTDTPRAITLMIRNKGAPYIYAQTYFFPDD